YSNQMERFVSSVLTTFCHRNPLHSNHFQTHFIAMSCKLDCGPSCAITDRVGEALPYMRRTTLHLCCDTLSDSFSCQEAGREAMHQADGHGTSTCGPPLQDDARATPPRPVPSGLDGKSGAEAPDHCARFRGASHHRAAVAEAVSGTGRDEFTDPLGSRA